MISLSRIWQFTAPAMKNVRSGTAMGPKIRSYHVVHFVLSGKGVLHINQHMFECRRGDVFIIPAGKISFIRHRTRNHESYAWINFLGINSERYVTQLMASSRRAYVLRGLDTEKYKTVYWRFCLFYVTSAAIFMRTVYCSALCRIFMKTQEFRKRARKKFMADEIRFIWI